MVKPHFLLLRLSLCVLFLLAAVISRAADFYVAANASANGTGTIGNPWKLQTALNQPSSVHPGDTIWLRGGTYSGAFTSYLAGTSSSPITVREYAGERAILDGNGAGAFTLVVYGSYANYWGFEVTNSNPVRTGALSYTGVDVHGPNTKFINMVVHDASGQGFGNWSDASNSEISGCLIYYNGSNQQAHGAYAQNQTGTKWLKDNVVFRNNGFGLHMYTSGGHIDNMHVEGNTLFDTGMLEPPYNAKANVLLGADGNVGTSCTSSPQVAQNPAVLSNFTYHKRGDGGRELDLGYNVGSCNATATGNYFVGDTTLTLAHAFGTISITGNTFYGAIAGFSQSGYPSNTYLSSRPTGTKIFIRPNAYEAGRANVTIYNWDLLSAVNVDLSGILPVGSAYEIRNAADFFGAPVLTGTYNGGLLSLPMTGLSVAIPVGYIAPLPTGPEFNAFVVLPITGAPPPTPTKTNTPNPTSTNTPTPTATRTHTATPTPNYTATRTPTPGAPTATRTPTKTPTKTPTPNGSMSYTRIEAESPVLVAPMTTGTDSGAFGGSYTFSPTANAGTGAWTFNAPSTGTYYVWCRVLAPTPSQDSFFVKMDSGTEDIYDAAEGTWSSNWQWTRLNGRGGTGVPLTINPRTFSLSAGSHTLTFRGREASTKLDRVLITNDASFVPTEAP